MEPKKRKRAKHTRTKLGCSVCRIRHVKCDLTRPSCQRCTKTGRKCEGYPEPEAGSSQSMAGFQDVTAAESMMAMTMTAPMSGLKLNEAQASFLQFYQHHTAPELAGAFEDDFWSRLVLQFSLREDCVRYMVFALSSLHRHQSLGESPFVDLAVGHYAQALRLLSHHIMSSGGGQLDVTLLCSILCVTFEGLQNNVQAALVHLRSGLNLLHQWGDPNTSSSTNSTSSSPILRTSYWSPSGHLIRSTLSPFYTRLLTQVQTVVQDHGLTLPPVDEPEGDEENVFPAFESLSSARDTLFEHFAEAFSLRSNPNDPFVSRRKQLYSTALAKLATSRSRRFRRLPATEVLTHWSGRLEEFLQQHPYQQNSRAGLVLRIWKQALQILIWNLDKVDDKNNNGENGDGEEDDEQTPLWSGIIDLVGQVHSTVSSSFTAEISTVAVLYFVGYQCPKPHIRRQAIALLAEAPRKEGFWDSIQTANMLQKTLDEEENVIRRGSPEEEGGSESNYPLMELLQMDSVDLPLR